MKLVIGKKYKWKHEERELVYIGIKDGWYQFSYRDKIWCECLESDLPFMEIVE